VHWTSDHALAIAAIQKDMSMHGTMARCLEVNFMSIDEFCNKITVKFMFLNLIEDYLIWYCAISSRALDRAI
jgi:hypothetical protein